MAVKRCERCFREREEAKKQPVADINICGGCAMDVDAVIGFLEFCGYALQLTIVPNKRSPGLTADEEPPKPPDAARRRAERAADASEVESKAEKAS